MKKSKKVFVLLRFAIIFIFAVESSAQQQWATLPPPEKPETESTVELKEQVDKLLAAGDDVMIRRNIDEIFTLVDRLIESRKKNEALKYLAPAVQHNSWAFDYQLLYARLLQEKGETEIPRKTAELILQYAEKDEQINGARQLLHQNPVSPPAPMKRLNPEQITVILVPIGEPDMIVLGDLRRRLVERLGLSVFIKDIDVSVPDYSRDPFKRVVSKMRENIKPGIEQDPGVKSLLEQDGITSESLEQDEKVVEAYRRLTFSYHGADALAAFDARMGQLRDIEKQWDVGDIRKNLKIAAKPFLHGNIYFLGIVNLDVFAGESNFLFYTANSPGHFAITSYRRFTADFNQDTPNRKRLVVRALKSGLACIGFMIGVPRCSSPICPRTYPHNLQELDATAINLCDECRQGFQKVLGNMPGND